MIELGRRSTNRSSSTASTPRSSRRHCAGCTRRPAGLRLDRTRGERAQALGERGIYLRDAEGRAPAPAAWPPDGRDRSPVCRGKERGAGSLRVRSEGLAAGPWGAGGAEIVVHDADELAEVARQFGDQALVMKVVSKDILHKSDAGGVKLNLRGEAALRNAYDQIMSSCRAFLPSATIRGVLVTPMARKGTEVIIGVSRDPIFGPVMMFGLGGIFVEILEDVAFRAILLSRHDARSMVEQIKARKILEGARGEAAVDKDALVDLLLKVSSIVAAYPALAELDLNPILAYDDGYAVVDAR